jgi:hypothetical protein
MKITLNTTQSATTKKKLLKTTSFSNQDNLKVLKQAQIVCDILSLPDANSALAQLKTPYGVTLKASQYLKLSDILISSGYPEVAHVTSSGKFYPADVTYKFGILLKLRSDKLATTKIYQANLLIK